VTVQSYAGHNGQERPTSLTLEERTFQVVKIVARWYDIGSSCFEVVTESGTTSLLRPDLNADSSDLLPVAEATSTCRFPPQKRIPQTGKPGLPLQALVDVTGTQAQKKIIFWSSPHNLLALKNPASVN
jgi:hypothetical protein